MTITTTFFSTNRWHLLLSTSALLLTLCSLLAISISLETAYMWLVVVLMTILFLTTFTCAQRPPVQENDVMDQAFVEVPSICRSQQFLSFDLPPAYTTATGLPSGMTPPPSYHKIIIPPPKYDSNSKLDSLPTIHPIRHGSIQVDNFPSVFTNRYAIRHGSLASVQST